MTGAAAIWAVSLLGILLLGGCRSAPTKTGLYEVDGPRAAFFRNGPAQGTGPDVTLNHGDKVTVLDSAHGYSRVSLGTGQVGYMASANLRAIAPKTSPRLASGANSRRVRERNEPAPIAVSDEPLFHIAETPLVESTAESAPKAPAFRAPR